MAKFAAKPLPFGLSAPPDLEVEGEGEGLPSPLLVLARRRVLGIAEAKAILEHLPAQDESLHVLCTARMDLTDVVNCMIERLRRCETLHVATLGYNTRNLTQMLGWLDSGLCGSITLATSKFFRSYNGALWEQTRKEFASRKQPCACVYSHAKVITLDFGAAKYSIEGSANLCGNGSGREQFCLVNHDGLHDFHAAWIAEMVRRNGGDGESR